MVQGVIQKISSKQWDDGSTSWTVQLQGDSNYYRMRNMPSFKEGDAVQFDIQQRGKNTYVQGSMVSWTGSGAQMGAPAFKQASRSYGNGARAGGGKFDKQAQDDYWRKREERDEVTQKRIEIQAARNAAIEYVSFLVEKDLIKIPTKAADKADAILAYVEQFTDSFMASTAARLSGSTPPVTGGTEGPIDTPTQTSDEAGWD